MDGADALKDLSRQLRAAAAKDLRKEMNRGLRSAAKPLIADARQFARETLPKQGGLNEKVARSRFRVKITTGRDPGVRITATGLDARLDSQGRLRHPVYGNRRAWVQQKVTPGWFHVPMRRGAPEVRREMAKALDRIAKKLESA